MDRKPSWDRLYGVAKEQAGYFTIAQAAGAGYSPQLLAKHVRSGRVVRARRAIYRLKHFPASEVEPLVAAWLWSGRAGVVSHDSALALHGLSEAPARVHLTVPPAWRKRRLKVPASIVLHHGDVSQHERVDVGAVPVTSLKKTLLDCPSAREERSRRAEGTQYLCLICAETLMEGMPPAQAAQHLADYRRFTDRLRKRGQLVAGSRLLPAETATTVRVRRGRVKIQDGPFAETKELIGGFLVIRARTRAEAVRIASGIPGAHIGCVEVRPIADDPATLAALGLSAT